MGATVAITGAGGQLGRCLSLTAPGGVEVRELRRGDLDVADPEAVAAHPAFRGVDAVINAAAATDVDGQEDEPDRAEALNAAAPGHLARRAAEEGALLVHVSTDYVFGNRGAAGGPIGSHEAPDPASVYGRTKLAGERAVHEADPRHAVVRTSWLYSGDVLPGHKDFVSTMLRLARAGEGARVVADQVGTPTFAVDLARALWRLALGERPEPAPGRGLVLHAAGSGEMSWHGLAREVFAAAGADPGLVEPVATGQWPTRAARPAYSALRSVLKLPEWRSGVRRAAAGSLDPR